MICPAFRCWRAISTAIPVESCRTSSGRWQTPIRPMPRLKTENCSLRLAVSRMPPYADVILKPPLPPAGKTAKNVVVKVEQQPTLKTIRADMKDGFVLRLDENAVLADQFTAAGYDQYGREMTGGSFEWVTSKPDVVSLENGTPRALKEDSTEIYARSGDIESKPHYADGQCPETVWTAITADGIPSSVRKNTTLDLSAVKVTTLDQFGKAFNSKSWRPIRLLYDGRWKRMIRTPLSAEIHSALVIRMAR